MVNQIFTGNYFSIGYSISKIEANFFYFYLIMKHSLFKKDRILPEKTVERLSEYRRTLYNCLDDSKAFIFSHELAEMHDITAVQVRRDIMFIGYSTSNRKGYNIEELIKVIGSIIDPDEQMNVAVIGYGNLGKAVSTYFIGKRPLLNLAATFDLDPKKTGSKIQGVECYSIDRLREIITNKDISIAILTVPVYSAKEMAKAVVQAGIKGILNFTTVNLSVPLNIYLEEYDMITSMEKVAYFVKNAEKNR